MGIFASSAGLKADMNYALDLLAVGTVWSEPLSGRIPVNREKYRHSSRVCLELSDGGRNPLVLRAVLHKTGN
jgi:hypothetical protein